MPCHVMSCHAMPCYAMPCPAPRRRAVLCRAVLDRAVLRCAALGRSEPPSDQPAAPDPAKPAKATRLPAALPSEAGQRRAAAAAAQLSDSGGNPRLQARCCHATTTAQLGGPANETWNVCPGGWPRATAALLSTRLNLARCELKNRRMQDCMHVRSASIMHVHVQRYGRASPVRLSDRRPRTKPGRRVLLVNSYMHTEISGLEITAALVKANRETAPDGPKAHLSALRKRRTD
eukprot:353286-Chlamydomonas_euryale.AAC.2